MDKLKLKSLVSNLLINDMEKATKILHECIRERIVENKESIIKGIIQKFGDTNDE